MTPELSPAILEELRARLESKRARLEAEIRELRADQGKDDLPSIDQSSDPRGDVGDASVELETRETTDQLELELTAQLLDVEHALRKIASGTYGFCEQCGRPIPLARLRVVPEARYDAEHQAEVEAHSTGR